MFKRPIYIAPILAALLTLLVFTLPHQTASQFKLAISSLFLPLFGFSKVSHQVASQAGIALTTRAELIRQNEELRQTNKDLLLRAGQTEILARENDRLRQLLGWQKQINWKFKVAKVIARDPANWWRVIQIDVGSRDGIHIDAPVITPEGLVGKVSSVNPATSQVVLIGTPDCKVSAVAEKTGDTGVIIGGVGPLDSSMVNLSFLSANNRLKPGQRILTSGEGNVFPKGILIGQLAEEAHVADLGYYEARVKLSVNLGALEEVGVMLP